MSAKFFFSTLCLIFCIIAGITQLLHIKTTYFVIPCLGICIPKELKVEARTNTHAPMFTAILFTRAKRRKQLKGPPTDEWLNKMGYLQMKEEMKF